jgi:outer membrane protein OmpA-like peptidoglycan-associated protein
VRYGQIVQPANIAGRDENDAQFLTVGIDFAFGPAYDAKTEDNCPPVEECVQQEEPAVAAVVPCPTCPDEDQDGVCDADDRCPTELGPPAALGCPLDPCKGPPLMVLVQFDFNSSGMPKKKAGAQTMDPVLDAVAAAIAKDPSCRVCIMGHASQEGPADHNQTLSSERAAAVQNYMTSRGINQSRVPAVGMGEKCLLIPESSNVLNRRVEFRRIQDGASCPTDCARR